MLKKLLFIKLGGSLISDKTKINKPRDSEIKKICSQIKELQRDYLLILFTGAGGFGHPVAKKYENNLEEGEMEIREACKRLSRIVVDAIINYGGLKAVSISPSDVATYKNGKMAKLLYGYIAKLLEEDIIPVFHADLVDDEKSGISILSMDKFLVDMAIYLKEKGVKIDRAVFIGSTPVTTPEVGDRPVRIVQKITKKSFFENQKIFYQGKGVDVSGGMKYKVEQCLRLADEKIESNITDDLLKKGTSIS